MQMADDQGQTRLDRAKMQIGQLAKRADQGVKISLIVASDEPYVALRRTDQWSEVQAFLKNLQAGQGGCDEAEAFRLMGEISGRVVHPEVCFYTDRAGEEEPQTERFSLVNVSAADREWNVSLDSMTYKTEGKTTVFSGTLSVTGKDAGVTVGLQIDGQTVNALFVECRAGEQVSFSLEEQTADFEKALFFVETEDGLLLDNSYTVCRKDQAERSVLIVGESPFYLERLFSALEDCRLTVAKTVAAEELSGYDLYVFDGTAPAILPFDGSVLLVHPEELPNGLTFGEEKSGLLPSPWGRMRPTPLFRACRPRSGRCRPSGLFREAASGKRFFRWRKSR